MKACGGEGARFVVMIGDGDGAGDVEAGRAAGVRTALVFAPNRCELCPLLPVLWVAPSAMLPDLTSATLAEVARAILTRA
jgi:hypothetical protein